MCIRDSSRSPTRSYSCGPERGARSGRGWRHRADTRCRHLVPRLVVSVVQDGDGAHVAVDADAHAVLDDLGAFEDVHHHGDPVLTADDGGVRETGPTVHDHAAQEGEDLSLI